MKTWKIVGAALVFCAAVTGAQALDALVEQSDPGLGFEPYQFLEQGRRIDLSGGRSIVLGYPASCVHESITGGRVTIGARQSEVEGGAVERSTLACGDHVRLTAAERQESGASAWRDPLAAQPVLVDNLAPVLLFAEQPDMITIQRTDRPASPIRLSRPGRALDLVERNIVLDAGGIYVVSASGRTLTIEIDFDAEAVGGPALTRFVRF
ncbi:MAG: hypothetical protein TEF_10170 [Rhizobiales bacterium NRL2]|jgi:hypothetical protein|nr:MAG: hypothetical protein TEF_10170 [Rhizobiales bacterium NRL2]